MNFDKKVNKILRRYLKESPAPVKTPVRKPVKPGAPDKPKPQHPWKPTPGVKPAPKATDPEVKKFLKKRVK